MAKTTTLVKTGKRLTHEQKLEMIKAVDQGKPIKTVAKVFGVERRVVYYWLERRKELPLQSQAIEQHGKAWLDTKTEREEEIKDLKKWKKFCADEGNWQGAKAFSSSLLRSFDSYDRHVRPHGSDGEEGDVDAPIASLYEEHREINRFLVDNLCERCKEAYLKFLREKSGDQD